MDEERRKEAEGKRKDKTTPKGKEFVMDGDTIDPLMQVNRGFGSVRGETPDEFHERMLDLDPLEALIYEAEFASLQFQQ